MKVFDIALKDMTQSFRSFFALAFMFGVPLLVTGMFYLMFGDVGGGEGFTMPAVRVQLVNEDRGAVLAGAGTLEMGEILADLFRSEEVADYVLLTESQDPSAARRAVDAQEAGVAVIIPPDFSEVVLDPEGAGAADVEIYHDPTLTLGPNVVKTIVRAFMDSFSGTQIAVDVAAAQFAQADLTMTAAQRQALAAQLTVWHQERVDERGASRALIVEPPPGQEETTSRALMVSVVGLIQTGMMIFYAFFTGTNGAQGILVEEEKGTLPRLFTTPTGVTKILSGKFLAVALTVLVQVVTLVLLSWWIFGVSYRGGWPAVALSVVGTVSAAATFGIFVNSWLKDTRQGGFVYGGVLTITGMLGIVNIFTVGSPSASQATGVVSLFVPQGWAMRAWQLTMEGAPLGRVALFFVGMMAWSTVFFVVGSVRFSRRYA